MVNQVSILLPLLNDSPSAFLSLLLSSLALLCFISTLLFYIIAINGVRQGLSIFNCT